MEIILWIVIVICFILSFVGLVLPVMPAVALIWVGAGIYHFLIDSVAIGGLTWGSFVFLTALMLFADQFANVYAVKRYGGSRWSVWASIIGVPIGLFFFPPLGFILVPFLLVFFVELLFQKRSAESSLRVAFGTLVAFAGSLLAKALMQLIMVVVFLIDVLS